MALRFQCCWSRCPRSIQFQPVASHGQRHSVLDLGLVTSRPWDPWDPWVSGCFQARSKFTWHNKKAVVVSRESFHLSSSSPSSFTPAQKMSVFRIIFTEFNLFQPNFAEDYLWQLPSSPRRGHMISHDSWSPIGYMRIYAVHIHRYTVYHLINTIKYQYIMHTYWHMCIHMSYVGIYNPCIYCIYIYTYPWILLYWIAFMQQCSEADADLLRGIAFEYIEAVCIGFFTVEYVSWMHIRRIRYSETMKWHNLEHQSSWIMRFCESCWHGVLDVKFRAVFGFDDWSKYIIKSQHHIRYYHIRYYHNA